MRSVPLPSKAAPGPIQPAPNCRRCSLSQSSPVICKTYPIVRGAPLVVLDSPTDLEIETNTPLTGRIGRTITGFLQECLGQPAQFAYAVKCQANGANLTQEWLEACRGHLAFEIEQARPSRIIAMGPEAMSAIMGQPWSSGRRGIGYVGSTPVFVIANPKQVFGGNPFAEDEFWGDVEWACQAVPPPQIAAFEYLQGGQDEAIVISRLLGAKVAGIRIITSFEGTFLGAAICVGHNIYLWQDERLFRGVLKACRDQVRWFAFDAKRLLRQEPGLQVEDVGLWHRLFDSDAGSQAADLACLAGVGGYHLSWDKALRDIRRQVQDAMKARDAREHPIFRRCDPGTYQRLAAGVAPDSQLYAAIPEPIRAQYMAQEAFAALYVGEALELWLTLRKSNELWAWREVLQPASAVLAQMEAHGLPFLVSRAQQCIGFQAAKMRNMEWLLAQRGLKEIGSHVAELAWAQQREPGITGVDADTLTSYQSRPEFSLLVAWRQAKKTHDYLQEYVACTVRGAVHTTFHMGGAATMRLSSTEPNVQNIQKETEDNEGSGFLRSCMEAPSGHILAELDYNQQEVRFGAFLSGDAAMLATLAAGVDFHRQTAELIVPRLYGRSLGEYSPAEQAEHRERAKRVLLGIFFGQGTRSLAEDLKITEEAAGALMRAILGQYSAFAAWVEQCQRSARETGVAEVIWAGRVAYQRKLWDIRSAVPASRGRAERAAYNTQIQGAAAFCILYALGKVQQYIEANKLRMRPVNTIHDSIWLLLPESEKPHLLGLRDILEGLVPGCPLRVKIKLGSSIYGLSEWPGI